MKRFIAIIIVELLLSYHYVSYAQTNPLTADIRTAINKVFEHTDLSKVPTGILVDYGIETIPLATYNGAKNNKAVMIPGNFPSFYKGLYSCIVNERKAKLLSLDEFVSRRQMCLYRVPRADEIPLCLLLTPYNRLDSLAIERGTMSVKEGQLYDVPGKPSPYLTEQCVVVAPLRHAVIGKRAKLLFPSELRINNMYAPIAEITVSCAGQEPKVWTPESSRTLTYSFDSYGIKEFTFTITLRNNISYYAWAIIEFKDPNVLAEIRWHRQQHENELRAANENLWGEVDTITIAPNGHHSGGNLLISYDPKRVSDKRLLKPLIIAEGFDVASAFHSNIIRSSLNFDLSCLTSLLGDNKNTFWEDVHNMGYDIVFLDYNNGMDDIRRNAALLEEVIRYVNREKEKNSRYYKQAHKEPNVVMGLSMGGLVAAYGLRSMELKGEEHETSKFISYDSPHYGATIPVSAILAARHFLGNKYTRALVDLVLANFPLPGYDELSIPEKNDYKVSIEEIEAIVNSPAAKQLLKANCDFVGGKLLAEENASRVFNGNSRFTLKEPFYNTDFNSFFQEYHDRGLPRKCYNIAFSNGTPGLNGNPLPYRLAHGNFNLNYWVFHPAVDWGFVGNIFHEMFGALLIPSLIPGIANLQFKTELNKRTTNNRDLTYLCELSYRKSIIIPLVKVPLAQLRVSVPYEHPRYFDEEASGGCYSRLNQSESESMNYGGGFIWPPVVGGNFWETLSGLFLRANCAFDFGTDITRFCFVNRNSALGVPPGIGVEESDFYRTYAVRKDKSEEHIAIDYHADTLLYELRNVPQIDFKPIIKGPVNVTGEQATYRVANHAEGMNYRWITCFENFYFHDSERSSLDYLRQTGTEPTFTVHFGKRKSDRAMIRLAYEKPDLTRDTVSYPILIGLPNAQYLTATQLQGEFVRLEQKPENSQTLLLPTVQLTWKGHGNITGIECKARFANGSGEEVPLKDVSIWDIRDWYTFSGYATSGGDNNELLLYKENLSPQSGDVRIGFTPTPDGDHLNFTSNGADTDLDWGGGDGINPPYVPEDLAEITYHRKCTCAPLLNQEQDAVSFYLAPLLRNDLNARSVNLSFRVRNAAGYSDWTPELTYRIEGPFDWHVVPTRVTDSDARIVLNGDQCKDSEGNPIRLLVRIYNRNWQEMLWRTISAGEGIGIDLLSPGTYIVTVQRYLKDGSLSFSPSAGQVVIKE